MQWHLIFELDWESLVASRGGCRLNDTFIFWLGYLFIGISDPLGPGVMFVCTQGIHTTIHHPHHTQQKTSAKMDFTSLLLACINNNTIANQNMESASQISWGPQWILLFITGVVMNFNLMRLRGVCGPGYTLRGLRWSVSDDPSKWWGFKAERFYTNMEPTLMPCKYIERGL